MRISELAASLGVSTSSVLRHLEGPGFRVSMTTELTPAQVAEVTQQVLEAKSKVAARLSPVVIEPRRLVITPVRSRPVTPPTPAPVQQFVPALERPPLARARVLPPPPPAPPVKPREIEEELDLVDWEENGPGAKHPQTEQTLEYLHHLRDGARFFAGLFEGSQSRTVEFLREMELNYRILLLFGMISEILKLVGLPKASKKTVPEFDAYEEQLLSAFPPDVAKKLARLLGQARKVRNWVAHPKMAVPPIAEREKAAHNLESFVKDLLRAANTWATEDRADELVYVTDRSEAFFQYYKAHTGLKLRSKTAK